MKEHCVFCSDHLIKEREITRGDLAFAFPSVIPIVKGHTLVCPVRCVATFDELTEEEKIAIFDLASKIKQALQKVFKAEGFNHAWNENKIAGQSVPHFHLHILPRKSGDAGIYEYEPRKFLYQTSGDRPNSPQAELLEISKMISGELKI